MDDAFKSFRDERGLDRWVGIPSLLAVGSMGVCGLLTFFQLVETLFKPLAAAKAKKKEG